MKSIKIAESTASDCGCRNQCLEKLSNEEKLMLIDSLYNGRPKNEFDLYLMEMIKRHEIRRRRPRKEEDSKDANPRPCSFSYSVMKGTQKITVCRRAFIQLHAVSHKAVYRLTNLLANGKIPTVRKRKHSSSETPEIPTETVNQIDNHIRSFPDHYIERPVTYLGAQLTVRTMYKLFCIRFPELKETVDYECYLKYFKEHFYRLRDIES